MDALKVLLLAFVHEDLAILAAAFYIVERGMSFTEALVVIGAGVMTNNGILYGLGAAARRLPWIRRRLIGTGVERARERLAQHLESTLVLYRFAPALMTPGFIGCGWFKVPFARFAAIAAATAAVYIPVVLALVVALGDGVLRRLAEHAWLVLLGFAVAIVLIAARKPAWALCAGLFARLRWRRGS